MNSFAFFLAVVVASVTAQRNYVDPKNAAILAEARYLSGDGRFGAAYVQEDGTEFKEETDQNGDRKGQYSYLDPSGKKITVNYVAGKNGFQVSGDHLPKAPAPLPVPAAHQPRAPVPQFNSNPQYNTVPTHRQQPQQNGGDDDGSYRPEIYEHPYAYRDNGGQQQYNQAPRAPVNPNPSHFHQGFNFQHNAFPQQQQQQYTTTTPQPNRFFPPGQLDLNRTPDGFNYQFQSRQ